MLTIASYTFGDGLLTVIEIALFVAWLVLLWQVITDLIISHDMSGFTKALWVVGLFIFPLLGSLAYLIVRGGEMHERQALQARRNHEAVDSYIRQAAGTSGPSGNPNLDELERLAALHRQGSLSDEEFQRAKDRLL